MVRRARIAAALAPLIAIAGCKAIAGYRDLAYAPADDAGCAPVALPDSGSARIRLVNAGTRDAASDFCVRPAGTTDWGRPIFAGASAACSAGLAYATATIPFAVPAGDVDVEAIPIGASCDAPPTSQATIAAGDVTQGAAVVTVLRMGGGATTERLVGLREEPTPDTTEQSRIRVVNGLDDPASIDVGIASRATLPVTVSALAMPIAIAPGGVEPATDAAALGRVDAQGYVQALTASISLAIVTHGESNAFAVVQTPPGGGDTQSLFAIGGANDPAHPMRALYCEDGAPPAGLLATCKLSDLATLAVDTVDATLFGAFAPFEDDRRPFLYDALAARTSDLMCILSVNRQTDKDGIAAAARAHFPYAYTLAPPATLDTEATDPTDVNGAVPPAPTAAPCAGIDPALVDAFEQCAVTNCSSTGDATGTVATTNCLSQKCVLPGSRLYRQGRQKNACFDCMLYYMISSPGSLQHGYDECTKDARQPFSFDGQITSMMLSRYPLQATQTFVLPSTGFRRAVLYAEVQLEDQPIDVYCAQLSSPFIDAELPYVGDYGNDGTTPLPDGGTAVQNGWQEEEDLQVKKVIAFVESNSAKTKHPAIIAGLWSASVEAKDPQGNVATTNASPEVIAALDQALGGAFVAAEPPGWVPVCHVCPAPANPYNGSSAPIDTTRTFLLGFAPGSVTDDEVWGNEPIVSITSRPYAPAPAGGKGPISEDYPRLVRVIRPRPR